MVKEDRNVFGIALVGLLLFGTGYLVARGVSNSVGSLADATLISLVYTSVDDIVFVLVLTLVMPFITLIFNLIFLPDMTEDLNLVCGAVEDSLIYKSRGGAAVSAINFFTLNIYQLWWFYNQGARMNEAAAKYQTRVTCKGWAYVLIALFLRPASVCLMAYDLNTLSAAYNAHAGEPGFGSGLQKKGQEGYMPPWVENNQNISVHVVQEETTWNNPGQRPVLPAPPERVVTTPVQEAKPAQIGAMGRVRFVKGQYDNNELSLKDHEKVYMGRDVARCQVVFRRGEISGLHCKVEYDGVKNVYMVTDYSTNGTFLNRVRRLPKGEPFECAPGSKISLAFGSEEFLMG